VDSGDDECIDDEDAESRSDEQDEEPSSKRRKVNNVRCLLIVLPIYEW
jgi:hypothetical protein